MPDTEVLMLVERVAEAQRRLDASLEGVTLEELYRPPTGQDWSVAEIVAHVCELEPFWIGKAHLMMRQDNPSVARTSAEEESRIRAVIEHASDSQDKLLATLQEAHVYTLDAIGQLSTQDLERVGHRPGGRQTTVKGMIESIARHVVEHANQIAENRRVLAKAGG